jgi:MFS family permease
MGRGARHDSTVSDGDGLEFQESHSTPQQSIRHPPSSGLLLGMFVSILAGTAVATLLPLIVSDLEGDQSAYTWVVTGTLLATTVSTPVWGKFAGPFNRKLLIQLAIMVSGSVLVLAGSLLLGSLRNDT